MENLNDIITLFNRFISYYQNILGYASKIFIKEIILIPPTNEIKSSLSNPVYFDSYINENVLNLIDQNEIDMKYVLEFAALKTFFLPQYLNIEGFMKIVFLALFANKHSRLKVGRYITEILNYAAQLYYDANGTFKDQLKHQIQQFFKIIDLNTFYHEFLISQGSHGQDLIYFLSLQSYFSIKFYNTIEKNLNYFTNFLTCEVNKNQ